MSVPPHPVAVLTLAEANVRVARRKGGYHRPAEPDDFCPGLPLYTMEASELRIGACTTPLRRHLAAGTTLSSARGLVTFRKVTGQTEIVTLSDACARFWVCVGR